MLAVLSWQTLQVLYRYFQRISHTGSEHHIIRISSTSFDVFNVVAGRDQSLAQAL
jgi:hypothetical protein